MRSYGISCLVARQVRVPGSAVCMDVKVVCIRGMLRTPELGLQEKEKEEDGYGGAVENSQY